MFETHNLQISTKGSTDIINITEKVQSILEKSKINNGSALIFSRHTTASVSLMKYEQGLLKDLPISMEKIIPKDAHYNHHETANDDNGHSHMKATLIGSSITIPITDSKLLLGVYQQVAFIDFDTKPRTREIIVQISGE